MFGFCLDEILEPIAKLLYGIRQIHHGHPELTKLIGQCQQDTQDQVCLTLFCKDHAKEWEHALIAFFDNSDTQKHTNYAYKALLKFQHWTKSANSDLHNSFPFFFNLFIKSYDSVLPKEAMFRFWQFLDCQLKEVNSNGTAHEIQEAWKLRSNLLFLVKKHNIYRPSNDPISKTQSEYLNSMMLDSISILARFPTEVQQPVMSAWIVILNLDFSLIEKHLDSLWNFLSRVIFCCIIHDVYNWISYLKIVKY
jgi:hypothetical protein